MWCFLVAQIFSLLGIRPIWHQENHRVTGVELIPLSELGRPRIDVTVRISGFFRDAFPHLITLLDDSVNLAINADEPPDQNYIRKHYLEDMEKQQSEESARYRIFGCPPGVSIQHPNILDFNVAVSNRLSFYFWTGIWDRHIGSD